VRLGTVLADVLANLEFTQLLNDVWTDKEGDQQCRAGGKGGAKRDKAEDAKGVKVRIKLLIQQPVKQVASRAGFEAGFMLILQAWT
jgi:hypothetical protein